MNKEQATEAALRIARGTYQKDIVTGREAWSGASLRGAAKLYGSKYKASRLNLLSRIQSAGIPARICVGKNNKLTLELGDV